MLIVSKLQIKIKISFNKLIISFISGKKAGYCGVAIYSKKEPLNVSYGLKNPELDGEGRIITAEYENFYLINVCKYIYC